MYLSLYNEAEVKFYEEMANLLNNHQKPFSKEDIKNIIDKANKSAQLTSQNVQEKIDSENLVLTNEEALEVIRKEQERAMNPELKKTLNLTGSITVVMSPNIDYCGTAWHLLLEHMDDDELMEATNDGDDIKVPLYLTNGSYIVEDIKKLLETNQWKSVIIWDRKNPINSSLAISIKPKQ